MTPPRHESEVQGIIAAEQARHDAAQAAGDAAAEQERHEKAGRDLMARVRRPIEDGGSDHGEG